MHRRDLLRALLATPIAATLDVERLLWIPRPMVTVPSIFPVVFKLGDRFDWAGKIYQVVGTAQAVEKDYVIQRIHGGLAGVAQMSIAAGEIGWAQIYGPSHVKLAEGDALAWLNVHDDQGRPVRASHTKVLFGRSA